MPANSPTDLKAHIAQLLHTALSGVAPTAAATEILIERPKQASHGDFASNLAMQLARALRANPREIAQKLLAALPVSLLIEKAEIAGAGFINFTLSHAARTAVIAEVLAQGADFGRIKLGSGCKVQVEFVSANPTGPLHVGHGRGAAYGASLAAVLDFAGYAVTREYYVNDAGRQMDILAVSTWLRYLELHDITIPFPPNAYQGDYVRSMALGIKQEDGARHVRATEAVLSDVPSIESDIEERLDGLIAAGKRLLGTGWQRIHQYALNEQLEDCKQDLAAFGVNFEVWYSENSLYTSGAVQRIVERLEQQGHIYVKEGAKWFRSTAFGDEKDRVVQRDNGLYTYFASDIAYHLEKFERGFDKVIDIWGADHHGYIPRVKGALTALGLDANKLDVTLVQFVSLYRNGEKASMSTRAGEYVTLRALREEVGNDACRFFYMLRKSDLALDFDLDLATSQSNDNPVYYVQYAHARICSVLVQAKAGLATAVAELAHANPALLTHPLELALCAQLREFPAVIEAAARDYAPHGVAFYLRELAAGFHGWYNAERLLVENVSLQRSRLALAQAVKQTLANGLKLLGVSAPESM
ncbi:Arginine--tRNA ligase [Georgfuchsia toluolica]|uniref:Arginine--tRNA ligase n=1 Tax=Georgfuchsia toluolica TaxID=424218 RepID=A0A916J6U6_9PROT|nr:arginine--tRNA ligase [Georgfuchsia toluolica]CAG4884265.1 Arginine--tRNA ligase [Georgfuchsia toluolica]